MLSVWGNHTLSIPKLATLSRIIIMTIDKLCMLGRCGLGSLVPRCAGRVWERGYCTALASFPGWCITGMRLSLLSWWHHIMVAWGEERMVIGMQAQLLKVRRDHYTLWSRVNTAVTMSLPAVPSRLPEGLESAGRLVDQHLKTDQTYVELSGQLRIATHRKSTYEVWSCTGWGMKLHELVSSARGCAISIYCTPQVFVERLMRLFWSILLLTNYVDSYSSLSIVYSLVKGLCMWTGPEGHLV